MATITERYTDPESFNDLLTEIGMSNTQVGRIQSDGFTTMKILVSHYQTGGGTELEKYLRNLNKTFANAAQTLRVYYNPVIINRFCGCLTYYTLCVYSFHTIPDLDEITVDEAGDLGSFWTKYQADKSLQAANLKTMIPQLTYQNLREHPLGSLFVMLLFISSERQTMLVDSP